MSTLPYGGPLSLSTIRNGLKSDDPAPYRFSDYRPGAGYIPVGLEGYPRGVKTVIPAAGPYSFSNFYGVSRFTTRYLGYIPGLFDTSGTLDITEFGERVPVDNSWYGRNSTEYLEFTTGPVQSGYTLKIEEGEVAFWLTYSYFYDPFSTWYRYFRVRRLGFTVTNAATGAIAGSANSESGDMNNTIHGDKWGYVSTGGPHTIDLDANTTYRVHYYVEFLGDNSRGYAASRYAGGKHFWGITTKWTYCYLTNK